MYFWDRVRDIKQTRPDDLKKAALLLSQYRGFDIEPSDLTCLANRISCGRTPNEAAAREFGYQLSRAIERRGGWRGCSLEPADAEV